MPDKDFESVLEFVSRGFYINGHSLTTDFFYKYPYCFYRWFIIFLFTIHPFCSIAFAFENIDDMAATVKGFVTFNTGFQAYLKTILFTKYHYEFVALLSQVRKFRASYIATTEENIIVGQYNKLLKLVSFICFALCIIINVCATLPSIFVSELELPLPYFFPFLPYDRSPYFELNFSYQILMTIYVSTMVQSFDVMLTIFFLEACMQLDVIKEKLSHIGENEEVDIVREKHQLDVVHEIHVIHEESIQYIYDLNASFSTLLLMQFASSTFAITTLLFRITQATDVEFYEYGLALVLTSQLFIWCFFGDLVSGRMNNILRDMYDNHWHNLCPTTRRSLIIMMSCSQRQYFLTAGGWANLNLEMFVQILKTGYSYYAVMQDSKE